VQQDQHQQGRAGHHCTPTQI
jgi:hypothetical protein